MFVGVEAPLLPAPGGSVGKDASDRLGVPGDDDLPHPRERPLRLWPPQANVAHRHRFHPLDVDMFHKGEKGSR